MEKSQFEYNLPEELIAQEPLKNRDQSRLMHIGKTSGSISHRHFYELPEILSPGDLLILNDSRVLPARLYGQKIPGGAAMQFLLLEAKGSGQPDGDIPEVQPDPASLRWEVMVRPGGKAKPGSRFSFGDGILTATVLEVLEGGTRLVRFECDGDFYEILDRIGRMPLPHYITKPLEDNERYQTVYSSQPGSAAAPTAGLHFTPELLERLRSSRIDTAFVTLHVGIGTFRPVSADKIEDHKMHSEYYIMPKDTSDKIRRTKENGGRIIAVGTTSCRTLEACASKHDGRIFPDSGKTDIFIYPGYNFRATDGIITNFHLPGSTLIMMISAFAGHKNTMNAYAKAVDEKYRFFSFGDAMLIL